MTLIPEENGHFSTQENSYLFPLGSMIAADIGQHNEHLTLVHV